MVLSAHRDRSDGMMSLRSNSSIPTIPTFILSLWRLSIPQQRENQVSQQAVIGEYLISVTLYFAESKQEYFIKHLLSGAPGHCARAELKNFVAYGRKII
jgi:hypothetical protein